jgi:hypothetical protein
MVGQQRSARRRYEGRSLRVMHLKRRQRNDGLIARHGALNQTDFKRDRPLIASRVQIGGWLEALDHDPS